MSTTVPNWWLPQMTDGIHQKFQSKGWTLQNTTRPPSRVNSNVAQWNRIAAGTAQKLNRNDKVQRMNLGKDNVQATIEDYGAFEDLFYPDLGKMTPNEMEEAKAMGAMALGRKFDELEMAAVHAGAGSTGVYISKDGTVAANGLTLMLDAITQLQRRKAFMAGEMFAPMPALAFNQACSFKQFNNADYTGPDLAYVKGAMSRTWNGVHWFIAPDELFPVPTGTQLDYFIWNRVAVGHAVDGEGAGATPESIKTKVVDMADQVGYVLQMWMGGAFKVIDAEGIQRIRFDNASAITLN